MTHNAASLPDTIAQAGAYGGIVLTDSGMLLLREPSHHFDGYVWTFAKGRPEPGDTPAMTALREVREELGYEAEIIGLLPGTFQGGTGTTAFYVMKAVGAQGKTDWETQSTRWVSFDEASALIAQSSNLKGRTRDLAILAASRHWFETHAVGHPCLTGDQTMIRRPGGVTVRIIEALNGFRTRHGHWPVQLELDAETIATLACHYLTPQGFYQLQTHVSIVRGADGIILAKGERGETFDYGEEGWQNEQGHVHDAMVWLGLTRTPA